MYWSVRIKYNVNIIKLSIHHHLTYFLKQLKMKKILLFLVTVSFNISVWGQISEYKNLGNTFEFDSGQDPEFVEFNGKVYFIGDFNNANNEFILSIDESNQSNIEFDPTGGFLTDQFDIQALTVYNNQLYFALANLTTNPGNYFLYRLNGGIGELVSGSALVSDPYEARMIEYNNVLYFAGRENSSVPEIGLISYSPSHGFDQVNTTVLSEDFSPTRFTVGANNILYFFEEDVDFPNKLYLLYSLDTNSGSANLSTVSTFSWFGDGFNAPVVSVFGDKLIIISKDAVNGIEEIYQLSSSNVISSISGLIGISSDSFGNQINYNTGGIIYNGQLALFRASNSTITTTDFVDDRLVLLSGDGSFVEYELPNLNGAGFYGVENGALIFFATGSAGEKIYELRETTNNIFPTVRAILPFNTQDISPLFGKIFNDRLYYYGNPLDASDGSLRSLNYYDPSVLFYDPVISNQEELEFFGALQFRTVLQTLTLQNPSGSGTLINDLFPLSSLRQVDYLQINFTGIENLSGLENLEQIYRFFDLADNDLLTTLDGLNTNIVFDTETPAIFANDLLTDFCALQPWAASADPSFAADWAPNNNGYNPIWSELQNSSTCEVTLSIDNDFANEEENINIFPNPVNNLLCVNSMVNAVYRIYDLNGRRVVLGEIMIGMNEIDTALLQSGLYIFNISNDKSSVSKKFLKE